MVQQITMKISTIYLYSLFIAMFLYVTEIITLQSYGIQYVVLTVLSSFLISFLFYNQFYFKQIKGSKHNYHKSIVYLFLNMLFVCIFHFTYYTIQESTFLSSVATLFAIVFILTILTRRNVAKFKDTIKSSLYNFRTFNECIFYSILGIILSLSGIDFVSKISYIPVEIKQYSNRLEFTNKTTNDYLIIATSVKSRLYPKLKMYKIDSSTLRLDENSTNVGKLYSYNNNLGDYAYFRSIIYLSEKSITDKKYNIEFKNEKPDDYIYLTTVSPEFKELFIIKDNLYFFFANFLCYLLVGILGFMGCIYQRIINKFNKGKS